jgi:hypothetical protein
MPASYGPITLKLRTADQALKAPAVFSERTRQ